MKKLSVSLMLVLFTFLSGGTEFILAQSSADKTLVSGRQQLKKSDIETMIEFYEWAFQANFNSTQRADFQSATIDEFRADPGAARKTIDDIVKTFPQIRAASEELQIETRKTFLNEFLPEIRKNTDANSQMLLSIYEAANGPTEERYAPAENETENQTEAASNETGDAGDTSGAGDETISVANLSALSGKWVWGRSGSITRTTAGAYLGGTGSRHTYQFSAGGAVEYTGIMNTMTGGCRMQIFRSAKGRATLTGDTLTIRWLPASFSRDDSCSKSKNYTKTLPAETEVLKVNLKNSSGQRQLCLVGKDETCYSETN